MNPAHLVLTALGLAGFAVAAHLLRIRFGSLSAGRSVALLADLTIAISGLVVSSELLGALGLFKPLPFALGGGLLAIAAAFSLPSRPDPGPAPAGRQARVAGAFPIGLAIGSLLLVAAVWAGEIGRSLDAGIYLQDSTWYHLPLAAGFVQDGQIGGLQLTDPLKLVSWFYPQNGELIHAVGILAAGTEFPSLFLNLAFAAALLLAAWSIGGRSGTSHWSVALAATVLLTPTMVLQAGNAPNDVAALAFLAICVALLCEARPGEAPAGGRACLAVSGLAAGLAAGTKLTMMVPVAVIFLGLFALGRRGRRIGDVTAWALPAFATGGFWYLRNLIVAGNPLPWIGVGPFPETDQANIYPRPANSVADYLAHPSELAHSLLPGAGDALGLAWPAIFAFAAAGVVMALLRRRVDVPAVLGLAALATAVAYVFNPISASGEFGSPTGFASNLRYALPAVFLGFVCFVSVLGDLRGRAARAVEALLTAMLLVTALSSAAWTGTGIWVGALLIGMLAAGALALFSAPGRRRTALGIAAVGLALFTGAIAHARYEDHRYEPGGIPSARMAGFRSSPEWRAIQAWGQDQRNAKIAIAGPAAVFGQYVFYGRDLSNRVVYLGEPRANGGITPLTSCEALRSRVNDLGADFVVTTPLRTSGRPVDSQEAWWLRDDPHAREVLRAASASVFEIRGRLEPALCYTRNQVRMVPNLWGGSSPVSREAIRPPGAP